MKVAIYSRKSLFTGKGESVENQIEMCKQYIKFSMVDIEIADEDIFVYEDEGYSAKDLKRPQFQQMMKDLDICKFKYIVCYRLDRLSRNVSDFSGLIELLNDKGVNLICIKEHFDTSSPMGKTMMYITSVFAQLERETIENLKKEYEKEQNDDKTDKIKKDIKVTQSEINTLVNRLTDTTLSQISINAIDKKIVEQTEYLHTLESELAVQNQTDNNIDFDTDALIESVKSFKNLFDDLSIYDKRQIIRLLIQKIEWDGNDLHIFMYGE